MAIHVKLDDLLHARRMTLDAICKALACQPDDLLHFVEE
jgi:DNA-binding Xre family transcriptional regulator